MDGALTLSFDMALVLVILGLTVILFVREWVSADVAALVILVVLGLTQLVPVDRLFDGFASNAVMSVLAVMVLGAGLDRTGVMGHAASLVLKLSQGEEKRLVVALSLVAGTTSAFMQNPAVVALFLPVASRIAARTGYPLAHLLMPMGFCVVLGGTMSMVGNSPMILLNDLLLAANRNLPSGAESFRALPLFAVLPVGLALFIAGILYFRFYGSGVLEAQDDRQPVTPGTTESYFEQVYGIRGEVFELTVEAGSALIGHSIQDAETLPGAPLILAIKDNQGVRVAPPGDQLLAQSTVIGALAPPDVLEHYAQQHGLSRAPQVRQLEEAFNPARSGISEAVIPPNSRFIGKTIGELRLRKRYGISPLALTRGEEVYREDIRKVVVQAGDCLVFHSGWPELAEHVHERDFVVITDFPQDEHRPQKLWYAVIFFALGYGLALVGHFPLSVALLAGAVGMLLTGVLSMDEAYRAISWKTIFVLACLIPLGAAVDNSGTAAWLSQEAFAYLDGWPIWLLQLAIALLSAMAAMAISQIGATVLMVPMAINLALAANASPLEFALIAAFGASNNFLTVSNAVNSLISGPGSYRPRDFLHIGLPLTIVFAVLSVAMVNWVF
ncbi:MAG: SLC13 family permease [Rhodanobacteraceae bacterium]|nr:SLC13 family permease [Rhodanobacteraceae bacterium]